MTAPSDGCNVVFCQVVDVDSRKECFSFPLKICSLLFDGILVLVARDSMWTMDFNVLTLVNIGSIKIWIVSFRAEVLRVILWYQ